MIYFIRIKRIMQQKLIISIAIIIGLNLQAFSQRPHGGRGMGGERPAIGVLTGQVFIEANKAPLQYANVILYSMRDSTQTYGTTSDKNGHFEITAIRVGGYFAKISFMSYETVDIPQLKFGRGNIEIDLGEVYLKQATTQLESAEVMVDRPEVVFKIDKKVINVSKQLSVTSGSAIDVLESVPSVTIDIDGNVQLRGSGSFTVLVDGIPSMLGPSDALRQIPVGTIEYIEIMTNPSAKYDPDGVAGIINVLLKKNRLRGFSGSLNTNNGKGDRYGGDFLITFKNDKYSYLIGIDLNKRVYNKNITNKSQTKLDETVNYVNSNGESPWSHESMGIRGSLDFDLNPADKIRLGFNFGERTMQLLSDLNFEEWDSNDSRVNYYRSDSQWDRTGKGVNLDFEYIHEYGIRGHTLNGHLSYSDRSGDEEAIDKMFGSTGEIISGNHSTENGPGIRYLIKLDYTLPIEDNGRFEAGYQSRLGLSEDATTLHKYNTGLGEYVHLPEFDHDTKYHRDIHSMYLIYANEVSKLGYQAGLRGEYTDRLVEIEAGNKFSIDRKDLFPTAHFSYQLTDQDQVMTSYARRIERPRGWYLEWFETWTDAYNLRIGNPNLKPEYIDSYELSYQKRINRRTFSVELYHRQTENKIERVRSVYAEKITLHSTENVGTERSMGTEIMLNMKPLKLWNFSVSANIFDFEVKGELNGEDFSRQSSNWSGKFNNDFQLNSALQFQLNGFHVSKSVSSQGTAAEYSMIDIALRYNIIPKMLSATFQVRDILQTGNHTNTYNSPGSYLYNHVDREAHIYMLNVNYIFNNYQHDRSRDRGGMGDDEKF